jgi:hypothetical protein
MILGFWPGGHCAGTKPLTEEAMETPEPCVGRGKLQDKLKLEAAFNVGRCIVFLVFSTVQMI